MSDEDLQRLLTFFKAMADETRLKIVGVLAQQECSVDELAAMLKLKEPTISHHLGKLRRDLDILHVRADGTRRYFRLDTEKLRALHGEMLTPASVASLAEDIEGDAWEHKVLRDFFVGERLKEIPASRKKRLVVLRWLAARFEAERRYPEAEVNSVIKRHHPDPATLRRELIGYGLMERDAGIYWRPAAPAPSSAPEAAVTDTNPSHRLP